MVTAAVVCAVGVLCCVVLRHEFTIGGFLHLADVFPGPGAAAWVPLLLCVHELIHACVSVFVPACV
jgi:hypothetical protein